MIESLTPPEYVAASSVGIDKVITIVRNQLKTIPEIAFNLGRVMPQSIDGKLEPWINRTGTDEYYKAYPNDTLDPMSFSCIYPHEDERWLDEYRCTRTVSIIVWADLVQLKISLEELKRKVRLALQRLNTLDSTTFRIKDQTASGANGIYPGFDTSGFNERYLTSPYGGIRLEATARYEDICYSL